ncbi:UrcA family protein [Sphingobium sp. CR28]|uniref:UrcA family protein n=1 Tax=Sphingobium sp. CR28 TaxID=3400272 RepID=UPI003FED66C2
MPNFISPRLAGAFALGVAAFAATGAAAADQDIRVNSGHSVTRTVEVRTADLDLSSATGRDALRQRIAFATQQACDVGQGATADNSGDARSCLNVAQRNAEAQLRYLPGARSVTVASAAIR